MQDLNIYVSLLSIAVIGLFFLIVILLLWVQNISRMVRLEGERTIKRGALTAINEQLNNLEVKVKEFEELKATHTILEKCLNSSKKQDKVNATCLWFDGQKVTKAHSSDAGWDLQMPKDLTFKGINNGGDAVQNHIITTNHKVLIPNGCVGLILPRSSTQKLGVDLPVGVIDPGYKGYLKIGVRAINLKDDVIIKKGERIAQLVIVRLSSHRNLIRTDFSSIQTPRGEKGFGSSGK